MQTFRFRICRNNLEICVRYLVTEWFEITDFSIENCKRKTQLKRFKKERFLSEFSHSGLHGGPDCLKFRLWILTGLSKIFKINGDIWIYYLIISQRYRGSNLFHFSGLQLNSSILQRICSLFFVLIVAFIVRPNQRRYHTVYLFDHSKSSKIKSFDSKPFAERRWAPAS